MLLTYRVLSVESETFRIKHVELSRVIVNVLISMEIVKGGFSIKIVEKVVLESSFEERHE